MSVIFLPFDKTQIFPVTSNENSEGGQNIGLPPAYFDIRHQNDGRDVSCNAPAAFIPQEM
jgi:hypothetical protein